MSNQFGLMLSLIFLAYSLIFAGELVSYQKSNAIFMSNVNQIAHHLQIYGYDNAYLNDVKTKYDFSDLDCSIGEGYLYIECYQDYNSLTSLCSFFNSEFTCSLYIYL